MVYPPPERIALMIRLLFLLTAITLHAADRPALIVVNGTPGTKAYADQFSQWTTAWKQAAQRGGYSVENLQRPDAGTQLAGLQKLVAAYNKPVTSPLWLVLIGHGTFDGKKAKFNLHGPDLDADTLAQWLKPLKRPLVIINCTASSAPFLSALSGPNRVIITATRSGFEQNFSHLGRHLAKAIGDPTADLDKDGQTSLLEAWLIANRNTAAFYKNENRLATEHSLLDDNADAKGTPADWFRGLQVIRKPEDAKLLPDGLRAHQLHLIPSPEERALTPVQRAQRDVLELNLAKLRAKKEKLTDAEYYPQLEKLLLKLSEIYFAAEKK